MLKLGKKRKVREDDSAIINVDGIKLDAESVEVVYADPEKDIQVVVSDDPTADTGVVVAVLTNSEEEVENEGVLGSAAVVVDTETDEARRARREAYNRRRMLMAKRAEQLKKPVQHKSFKKAEAKVVGKPRVSASRIEEARARFRKLVESKKGGR